VARSDSLARVSLLSNLPPRELADLGNAMREHTYAPGEVVTGEGTGGVGFFVILDGTATVSISGREQSKLGPGDHFGELALIDGEARAATITAETELRCLSMTAWEFRPFVKEHPDVAWALLEGLVRTLRSAGAA
jgi:CRP-like cAMP-binding protein